MAGVPKIHDFVYTEYLFGSSKAIFEKELLTFEKLEIFVSKNHTFFTWIWTRQIFLLSAMKFPSMTSLFDL